MRGRSSHRTPGSRRRRGPIHENGLARSDHMGSVRILIPPCCSSTVAWLINVTRNCWPSTHAGGFEGTTSAIKRGDFSGRLLSFHRRTPEKLPAWEPPGLKNRLPSKCCGNGEAPALCCTISIYSQVPGALWGINFGLQRGVDRIPNLHRDCGARSSCPASGARHLWLTSDTSGAILMSDAYPR